MSVKMRQIVEREIATSVVKTLLKAGFALSVDNGDNNGDEFEIANSRSKKTVLEKMFQTDEERVYAIKDGKLFGWVYFVYGNDGWDVISDYTVNLEKYIGEGTVTDRVINKYAD